MYLSHHKIKRCLENIKDKYLFNKHMLMLVGDKNVFFYITQQNV